MTIASLLIFVAIVEALKRRGGLPEGAEGGAGGDEVLRIVFYVVAIMMVFVTNVVQGFILKGTRTDDMGQITGRLTTVNVITAALSETPVVMGFVLYVFWGYYTDFYVLGFVSLYLMIRHYPYYRQWEKFAKDRMGDGWPSNPVPS
jgi:hypothetical protein